MWAVVLAGPIAWAIQLGAVYIEVAWACADGPHWLVHVTSLVCLLTALTGGYFGCVHWRRTGWPESSDEPDPGRVRLMSAMAMLLDTFFAWVILAQWLAVILLPCGPRILP
jgi:hypothetical protein